MRLVAPCFTVGTELEFFLRTDEGILNAKKVMHRRLGFSIDQNDPRPGCLDLGAGTVVHTDGTTVELQYFNDTSAPCIDLLDRVERIPFPGIKDFTPYLKEGEIHPIMGDEVHFHEPGNTFNGGKTLNNAYTGHSRSYQKKKESTTAVTMRTAGLHFHFSINPMSIREAGLGACHDHAKRLQDVLFRGNSTLSSLVKIADRVFADYFNPLTTLSQRRKTEYAMLGDYRVRAAALNKSGFHTFEYRQLDASMYANANNVLGFVRDFQIAAVEYLNPLIVHV